MKAYLIYTYGGAEVLEAVFNGIASLVGGGKEKGVLFGVFVRLGFSVGLVWVVLSAIQGQFLKLLASWMFPFYALLSLFFIPTTSVWFKDLASGYIAKVDNVPWGLGALAGTVSGLSHKMTEIIESVFSLPDDLKYHQTGAMMASQLIAHSRVFHITNAEAAETMKDFMNQCVVYDALLGVKYTLDDLKRAPDIWELVKEKASPARSFTFREPGCAKKGMITTCAEGVVKLERLLNQEVEAAFHYFGAKLFPLHKTSSDIFLPPEFQSSSQAPRGQARAPERTSSPIGSLLKGYLGTAFGYMAGLRSMSESGEAIMRQQMMIYSLIDGIESKSTSLGNASNFALRRAYLQQRTHQASLGSMAEKTMIAFKNVMEALIYVSFIFIVPLILLPRGWRFVGNWASLVVWVNMWPPLYAVIHFLMMVAARSKGIPSIANDTGITIANSVGFTDLHADMAACAGYLSLSVGALSYALVRGGVSGFNHLTGSLTGLSVPASQRATEDLLSGNYSFGNVSLGSVQAYNESFGQQMHSPSYSSGFFSQNDGTVARTTGMDGHSYVTVANSQLRSSLNWGETMSSTFSEQASQAMTASQGHSQALTKSLSQGYRDALEFASHQASSQSHGEASTLSKQTSEQKSYTQLDSLAHNFAQENKISKDQAWQVLGRVSASLSTHKALPGVLLEKLLGVNTSLEGSGQLSHHESNAELTSKAMTFAKSEAFQKALQETINYTREGRFHQNDETSKRLNESLSSSLDKAETHRSEAQASFQKAASYNKAAQYAKQNSTSLNASLNQEFVEWLPQQSLPQSQGPMGRQASETLLSGDTHGLIPYQQRFLETYNEKFKQDVPTPAGAQQRGLDSFENAQQAVLSEVNKSSNQPFQGKAVPPNLGRDFHRFLEQKEKEGEDQMTYHQDLRRGYINPPKDFPRSGADREVDSFKKFSSETTSLNEKAFSNPPSDPPILFKEPQSPSSSLKEEGLSHASTGLMAQESPPAGSDPFDLSVGSRGGLQAKLKETIREEIHQALDELNQGSAPQDLDPQKLGLKKS